MRHSIIDPALGAVIPAASSTVAEVAPPKRATEFDELGRHAVPGIDIPDLDWDPVSFELDLGPDVDEPLPGSYIARVIDDWDALAAGELGRTIATPIHY